MIFNRNKLIKNFPWLNKKNLPMIISADYDGLICASFLKHHLNWRLEGYYDLNNIWISENGIKNKKDLIWVDLNILPEQGRAIGGHIISINEEIPKGFNSSCNPNILAGITAQRFEKKFPFSTLIYLLWIYNIEIKSDLMARMLVLHSDATWLKYQNYKNNCLNWQQLLADYNWKWLFQKVNTKIYEKRIDELLYPILHAIGANSSKSKLKSKHLNIYGKQYQFNPDWDEDIIIQIFNLFGRNLCWTPPDVPKIVKFIKGNRQKIPLAFIKQFGLHKFLNKKHVFSYAIPSPRIFNFTTFGRKKVSPIR